MTPDYSLQAILRRVAAKVSSGQPWQLRWALEEIAREMDAREDFEAQVHEDALNDSMDHYGSGE